VEADNNSGSGMSHGTKGRIIVGTALTGAALIKHHVITLVDSNPDKTHADPRNRPQADAADTWIGLDNPTNTQLSDAQLAFGSPISISGYINNVGDGTSWLENLTATLKTFAVPVAPSAGIKDSAGLLGTTGQVLQSTETGVLWATGSGGTAAQNSVNAGPAIGGAGAPSFRALVAADLPVSGVTAGSYTNANLTVNAEGQITVASNGSSSSGLWSALGNAASSLTLANTTYNTTFNQTSPATWTWANVGPSGTQLYGPDTGNNLASWTCTSWCTQDASFGNPAPSYQVSITDAGDDEHMYITAGVVAGCTISFDIYIDTVDTPVPQFFFGCTSAGVGSTLVMDGRPGHNSGIQASTGFTGATYTGPGSAPSVSTGVWHTIVITIDGAGTHASWTKDGVTQETGIAITLSGPYIGLYSYTAFSHFDNISVVIVSGGANYSSPVLTLSGQMWTGSAYVADAWSMQTVEGTGRNGTSTLTLSHSGSSGASTVQVPALTVTGALTDGTGSVGTSGQVLSSTVTGTEWVASGGGSLWSALGNAAGSLTLANTTYNTTFNQTSPATWTWANLGSGPSINVQLVASGTTTNVNGIKVAATLNTTGATLLVAFLDSYDAGAGAPNITDGKSNTWQYLTTYGIDSTHKVCIAYAYNPSVGTGHTFQSNNTYSFGVVYAFSGTLTTSGVYDSGGGASGPLTSPFQPGSITPTAGDLVICGFGNDGESMSAATINSGFAAPILVTATAPQGAASYLLNAANSALNPTWTTNSTVNMCAIACFKGVATITPQNSPALTLQGVYTASGVGHADDWSIQTVGGSGDNGTSTLTFSHAGSSGTAAVSVPALAIAGTLTDASASVGTSGQMLTSTATGTKWSSLSNSSSTQTVRSNIGTVLNGAVSGPNTVSFTAPFTDGNYTVQVSVICSEAPGTPTVTQFPSIGVSCIKYQTTPGNGVLVWVTNNDSIPHTNVTIHVTAIHD
jgi:hypothetical protein